MFQVKRDVDGEWMDDPLVINSHTKSLTIRVAVLEANPESNIAIALVETAVGLGPGSFQDAAAWSELTADWNNNPGLVETSITGLQLEGGVQYYVHLRTTNTLGRQSIVTAPTRVFIDTSPPVLQGLEAHNGASIMLQYSLRWVPATAPAPEFSSTYWMVGAQWEFVDPEADMRLIHVRLVDAHGDPTDSLTSRELRNDQAAETSILIDKLQLKHGDSFQVHVRGQSWADLWAEAYTDPITIDLTPPSVAQVLDLASPPTVAPLTHVAVPGSPDDLGLRQPELATPAVVSSVEVDFAMELSQLRVAFAAWDEDSGVDQVIVAVGLAPGSATLLPWTAVDTGGRRYVDVPLPDGVVIESHKKYFVSVAAVNGAGTASLWASSDGVLVDDTPPVCVEARVRDGTHWMLDADFQSSATTVTAQWRSALFDIESQVGSYNVTLVDSDTNKVVAGPLRVGLATRVRFTELALQHNQTVHTVVSAINRAGGVRGCPTNGVQVDLTPPLPLDSPEEQVVLDGNDVMHGFEGHDVEFTSAQSAAFVSWEEIHDPESGLASVLVWAEASDGSRLSAARQVHPSRRQWVLSIPTQATGSTYFVAVQALNNAGATRTFRSDGVSVDTSPPAFTSPVTFSVAPEHTGLLPHVISSTNASLSLSVTATDAQSGIKRCRFALGTYPDGSDVSGVVTIEAGAVEEDQVTSETRSRGGYAACTLDGTECTDVPRTTHSVRTSIALNTAVPGDVRLVNGFTLYAWLVCTNGAGQFVRDNAPTALLIDAAPPAAGLVFDGLAGRTEVDFTASNETFAGNWRWWADFESSIVFYEAALGTAPGLADAAPWTNVGTRTTVFFSLFGDEQLRHGVKYYLTVRATDEAGHSTAQSSDGTTVDLTPPLDGDILHGLGHTRVSRYSNRRDVMELKWEGIRDPESGVIGFEYGVSSAPALNAEGQPDMVPFVPVGLATQAAAVELALEHGVVYYGSVRAKNGVGMRSVSFSRGVLVDLSPPLCETQDGTRGEPDMDFSTAGFPSVYVSCMDLESGVGSVRWGLGTVRGWDDTVGLSPAPVTPQPVPGYLEAGAQRSAYHTPATRNADSAIAKPEFRLLDGVRYYAVVEAVNGAGTAVWMSSDGQVHDASPPAALFIRDTLAPGTPDVDFTTVTGEWGVEFDVRDPHTGLGDVTVELVAGGSTVLDAVMLSAPNSSHIRRSVQSPLPAGQLLRVRLTAANSAGLISSLSSDGWVIDLTPPVFDVSVTHGEVPGANEPYHNAPGSLPACWTAHDDESPVVRFRIAVANATGDAVPLNGWSVVPFSASAAYGMRSGTQVPFVQGVTCAWASGVAIRQGASYRVVVQAENAVGMTTTSVSTGVKVDWTAPAVGPVFAGPGASSLVATPWQTSRASVSFAWSWVAEPETPLVSVVMALGTLPLQDDVVGRMPVPAVDADSEGRSGGVAAFTGLQLRDGMRVYATLWATNAVGRTSARSSAAVLIDGTAPLVAELPHLPFAPLYAMPQLFDAQPTYPDLVMGASVSLTLTPLQDPHSGLASVSVSLYQGDEDPAVELGGESGGLVPASYGGGWALMPTTTVDLSEGAYSVSFAGVNVTNATYVWAVVTATNPLGLSYTTGTRATLVRTDGLSAGFVNDGDLGAESTDEDMAYQHSTVSYSARWNGFTDPRSVIRYQVCLGTAAGLCDVSDWESTGVVAAFDKLEGLSVEPGTTVYATVEASTDLGLRAQASSNGIVMGSKAPVVEDVAFVTTSPEVQTTTDAVTGAQYLSSGPLSLRWNASDEQGVDHCDVEVHASPRATPGGQPLLAATVGGNVSFVEWDVSWEEGQPLYASVSCTNIRGRTTQAVAGAWGIVETTSPEAGVVELGDAAGYAPRVTSEANASFVHWYNFKDDQSGVMFVACLGTMQEPCSEAEVATELSAANATGLQLSHGTEYMWTVTATNGAGMTVVERSAAFRVDLEPPATNDAFVSDSWEHSPAPRSDAGFLEAEWGGFADTLAGVDHYVAGVGTAPGAMDVAGPVTLPADTLRHGFGNLTPALSTGGLVYVSVTCVDAAGNTAQVSSAGAFFDGTPPVEVEPAWGVRVVNATERPDRTGLQGHTGFSVEWQDLDDPETGIARYEVSVYDVTTAATSTVLEWSSVGNATSFTHMSLDLRHGHTYNARVRAFNRAGGVTELGPSNAVALDLTPPVPGAVGDGATHAAGDLALTRNAGVVAGYWAEFVDLDAAIDHYEWCVGTSPGLDDVVPCHDVGLALSGQVRLGDPRFNATSLFAPAWGTAVVAQLLEADAVNDLGELDPDLAAMLPVDDQRLPRYYSTVIAESELGLRTSSYSDGVSVDAVPPATGMVTDAPDLQTPDANVQRSMTTLAASWFGFDDAQTRITSVVVRAFAASSLDVPVATQRLGPDASSWLFQGLALDNGENYTVQVQVEDEAGNVATAESDGVLVDSTGPEFDFVAVVGSGFDGSAGTRYREVSEDTVLTVEWEASDGESGVASYDVSLCPLMDVQTGDEESGDGTDDDAIPCALEWTNVRASTNVTLHSPAMVPGVTYLPLVRAWSVSGVAAVAAAEPVVVDATPPVAGAVRIVDVQAAHEIQAERQPDRTLPAIASHGAWDSVAVQWTPWTDDESTIVGYSVCAGSTPFADDVAPCVRLDDTHLAVVDISGGRPFAQSGIASPASLANLTFVFVTVIGHSGANMTSSAASQELLIDDSPPVAGVVLNGLSGTDAEFDVDPSDVCVIAEGFHDSETDVQYFEMCASSDASGDCDVAAMTRVAALLSTPGDDGVTDVGANTGANGTDATSSGVSDVNPFYELCLRDVVKQHAMDLYVTVVAVNGVGHRTSVMSSGAVVVVVPPAMRGVVVDAAVDVNDTIVAGAPDVDLYGQRRVVAATWEPALADPAPITSYEVAVCGEATGCNNDANPLSFFADVGLSTSIVLASSRLTEGETYQFHVRATNAAGLTGNATASDGFMVDTSPPGTGVVQVLSYGSVQPSLNPAGVAMSDQALAPDDIVLALGVATTSTAAGAQMWHAGFAPMHISWHSFGDPESGVTSYRVCVGSSASRSEVGDIAPCQSFAAPADYAVLTGADVNATAVAVARAAADAAAANVGTAASVESEDAEMDLDTGLIPPVNETIEVRSVVTAVVRVEACNAAGLCAPTLSSVVAVDFSAPVSGYVSGAMVGGVEVTATQEQRVWRAAWDPFTDAESGVAFYTVGVVDVDSGDYAAAHMNVGESTTLHTTSVSLLHGHLYATEVTAYNYAGLATTARSNATVVDVTPPANGFIHDVFDLDATLAGLDTIDTDGSADTADHMDADYGDAEVAAIEARWGDWEDAESGSDLSYEWAVMVLDPRQSNPVSATRPGDLLRAVVRDYLVSVGGSLDLPPRLYGTGHAMRLHEADNGLMFTDWLHVGNATSAFRVDVDLVPGNTYVVLLRVTNAAGLQTIASSDGIVFDSAEPCMGQPHAGKDPHFVPQYLTTEGEVSATWPAHVDPMYRRGEPLPFVCLDPTDSDSDDVDENGEATVNSTATVEAKAIPVVPLSHMEWRVRMLVPAGTLDNSTNSSSRFAGAVPVESMSVEANNQTSQLTTSNETLPEDDSYIEDTPPEETSPNATSVDIMSTRLAGPKLASALSGCCSSYSELNPVVVQQEWDWRPSHPLAGFGSDVAIGSGRFVGVGGFGDATVFDLNHPEVPQAHVRSAELHARAGVAGAPDGVQVHIAMHQHAVVLTAAALEAHALPLASAWKATPLARLTPASPEFTGATVAGAAFVAAAFTGVAATRHSIVAVTVAGFVGTEPARAVFAIHVDDDGVSALGAVTSANMSFGNALAIVAADGEADQMLAVGSPGGCKATPIFNVAGPSYAGDCFGGGSAAGHAGSVSLFAITESGLTASGQLTPSEPDVASALFGATLASAHDLLVVGDPEAKDGAGRVAVYRAGDSASVPMELCAVDGVTADGGLGFSVAVTHPQEAGESDAAPGTALVLAGAPGSSLGVVVRVNVTAPSDCAVVAAVRPSADFPGGDVTPPKYGAGTAVAFGGGVAVLSSPFARSWPLRARQLGSLPGGTNNSDTDLPSGTGRVFGVTYCWAGSARHPSFGSGSLVPSECRPCGDGEWSAGGTTRTCEECAGRTCVDPDTHFFTAINSSAPMLLGRDYEVDVTAVGRSGRRNTQTSPRFRMDWTPPLVGVVNDHYNGNISDPDCLYCDTDIDVQTNATYLGVSWCCGWQDPESGIASFVVAFGHSPDNMDIMTWTDVGVVEEYILADQVLVTGQDYYTCVVAKNNAGLFSDVVCSDGFTYDDTPPVMYSVWDGLKEGADVDTQSFLNMVFLSYQGADNETGVVDFVISFGSEPGLDDILAYESSGNATFNGVVSRPFDRAPVLGERVYANVYAMNPAGLVSEVISSDGVTLGKAELPVDRKTGGIMALDPVNAVPEGDDSDPEADDPPMTVALVDVPAGSVGAGASKLVGGSVSPGDVANGAAVNASLVPPPAQNLRFGDYSFTLKASDDDGTIQEGYAFEKPVRITMLYDVGAILEGEAAPADWEPKLEIYDVATGAWIKAQDTCPPEIRFIHVNHTTRRFSVDVCHLTQFALFYQRRPKPVLTVDPPSFVADVHSTNTSATLARLATTGLTAALVRLQRNSATNVLSAPSAVFNASDSYDPDGTVVAYEWQVLPRDERSLVGGNASVLALSRTHGPFVNATAVSRGVVEVQLTVTDDQEATDSTSQVVWFDEPPTAVLGPASALPSTAIRPPHGRWPTVLRHADVAGPRTMVDLSGALSFDPENATLAGDWLIVPGTFRARYSRPANASDVPRVVPSAASSLNATVANIIAGTVVDVALHVTCADATEGTDTAVATVIVNARPTPVVTGTSTVFLSDAESNFTLSAAESSDVDGSIVQHLWSVQPIPPSYAFSTSNLSAATLTVTGLTHPGQLNVTLMIVDNDGAASTSSVTTVRVLNCSNADGDGDGVADCFDGCMDDGSKTEPGVCGCGIVEDTADGDGDSVPDCIDECPADAGKTEDGICGCGVSDVDTDGDITADCHDQCDADPLKLVPGVCGCGVADVDTDRDGTEDCNDGCPLDRLRLAPDTCACGAPRCATLNRAECVGVSATCGACKPGFTGLKGDTAAGNAACVAMPNARISSEMGPSGTVVQRAAVTFTITFSSGVTGVTSADFAVTTTGDIEATTGVAGVVRNTNNRQWRVVVSLADGLPWCDGGVQPSIAISLREASGRIVPANQAAVNNGFVLLLQAPTPTINNAVVARDAVTHRHALVYTVAFPAPVFGFEPYLGVQAGGMGVSTQVSPAASAPATTWTWAVTLTGNYSDSRVVASLATCDGPAVAASYAVAYAPARATITALSQAPSRLPVFMFRVSFSVAVTDLDADDFTVSSGSATAVVTSVVPVAPSRVLAEQAARRLVTAHAWDVTVTVTANFGATPVILGLVDGGTEPRNQALPAVGSVDDPNVHQYAPVEVVVSPGELLTQAGFADTLGGTTSLTVLDLLIDFGEAGVTGVTAAHFVVDSPDADVSVQVSPVGSDGSVPTQVWGVVVTVTSGQPDARVRVYLDNSAGTIVPPPATRSAPVLDVTYHPAADSTLPWVTIGAIAAGVVLCGVCVCAVRLCKSHARGGATSKVAPTPAPGGAHINTTPPTSPMVQAQATPTENFAPVIREALMSQQQANLPSGGQDAAWSPAQSGGGGSAEPSPALVQSAGGANAATSAAADNGVVSIMHTPTAPVQRAGSMRAGARSTLDPLA